MPTHLFVEQLFHTEITETIKAPCYWPSMSEIHWWLVDFLTKEQECRSFHVMTSSHYEKVQFHMIFHILLQQSAYGLSIHFVILVISCDLHLSLCFSNNIANGNCIKPMLIKSSLYMNIWNVIQYLHLFPDPNIYRASILIRSVFWHTISNHGYWLWAPSTTSHVSPSYAIHLVSVVSIMLG